MYVGLFTDDGAVEFFDVENAPPRNQPPPKTISLAMLIERMRSEVIVRNEGGPLEDRYAADDPSWVAPVGSLPDGLEVEAPLGIQDALDNPDGLPDEDDEEV